MASQRGVDHARKILQTVREVRAEHSACTAREVARRLRLQHTLVGRQLSNLREHGLVEWTDMPGSIKLTPAGGKFANGGKLPGKKDDEATG